MLPRFHRSEIDIRKQQINTLQIFNANVVEICEGLEYQITFTSGRHELTLRIYLSKDFPNEKPLLKITPTIIHEWVNQEGEVTGAPGLLNFTIHSDLGRVAQAIIREFERNPPQLVKEALGSPTINIQNNERASPSYATIKSFSPPSHLTNPLPRLVFPELQNLSLEDLEFLNSNADRQQQFINELPPIREQSRVLDGLITQIEELAEVNLAKQDLLVELKKNVDVRIEEVTKLAFETERLNAEYQNMSEKYSPINIKDQLGLAGQQAEVESEKIVEAFLQGDLDVDKFVTMYTKTRSLCQTRKTKEEKLSQQLDSLQRASY